VEQICSECGYDYRTLMTADAPSVLRREARALAEAVNARQPITTVPAGSWSAVEYAGHVRDVLIVTRERTLNARLDNGTAVIPMGRDERVAWGEYDDMTPAEVSQDVGRVAEWLARTWERLSEDDWKRTVVYNYPEPQPRPLSWVAAHVVHELVHHRQDIESLTYR
jgi:hypothetical protein